MTSLSSRDPLVPGVAGGLSLVLLALAWVLVRLATVQLGDTDGDAERAQRLQSFPETRIEAQRGAILDRHGRLLAHTESLPSVAIDPSLLRHDPGPALRLLEQELGIPQDEVRRRMDEGGRRFAYLRRAVRDRDAVERLSTRAREEGVRGVIVIEEPVRVYPGGTLAAHVLGFTGRDGRGIEGAEALLESRLRGRPGARSTRRDGLGRRIVLAPGDEEPAVRGESVRLTLDLVLQTFAEQAVDEAFTRHEPQTAVAAVLDPLTGDLLACAVRPTFDPNDAGSYPADVRRNRFLTDALAPGSTFKPFVMALALDAGVVRPGDVFDCSGGVLQVGSRRIREDDHHDYKSLTAAGVLARSSNVGIVQVGQRLGCDRLYDGVRLFGFGTRTLASWAGETPGLVRPRRVWTDVWTLPSVSFGQEISLSPAQLLSGYGVLAAGGVLRPLRIVADEPWRPAHRVISEDSVHALTPMLEEVLISGTGRHVAIRDFAVAGKTGTAQKFVDGVVVGHTGAFGCFAPAEDPRLVVLVLCDQPKGRGYGGTVAAPYAVSLLRQGLHYLGVPVRASVPEPGASVTGEHAE